MFNSSMTRTAALIPLLLAGALLTSCKNPADETTDAQVGDAREKKLDRGPEGSERWVFAESSEIEFVGSKVSGATKSGGFKSVTGHFTLKDGKPVGNDHRVEIDMNSIWSESEKLTTHLRNEDFFDVPRYPTSVFDVTEIVEENESKYTVTGNLTMHGVTRSVSFPATVLKEDGRAKINAEFDIKRFEWDIEYKGKADDLINDEVILRLKLEAAPQ